MNESFNAVLWSRTPKINFVGLKTLKCRTLDATITFSERNNNSRNKVLNLLGISPGSNCRKILPEIDEERVKKADKACQLLSKIARQKDRMKKNRLKHKKAEEPEYDGRM